MKINDIITEMTSSGSIAIGAVAPVGKVIKRQPDASIYSKPKKKKKKTTEAHGNSKVYDKCWDGYKKVPGKKRGEKGSCVKEEETYECDDAFFEAYGIFEETLEEAEYQGRKVQLNKPIRSSNGPKKFHVFVKDGNKVKKVNFGDPNSKIKKHNPERRKNFRARHNCDQKKDKTTAGYWSCRAW